jgi:Family of unknown function (DUF6527)
MGKLTELNPQWNDGAIVKHYLIFDCPEKHNNDSDMKCIITLPINTKDGWKIHGDDNFETLTITPSIWHHCEKEPHFFITKGEIQLC